MVHRHDRNPCLSLGRQIVHWSGVKWSLVPHWPARVRSAFLVQLQDLLFDGFDVNMSVAIPGRDRHTADLCRRAAR